MSERERVQLSVLLFNEGDSWIAQCLEYDITSQGKSPKEALEGLGWILGGQILLDKQNRRKAFSTLAPAPERFWKRFKNGIPLLDPYPLTLPILSPDLPAFQKDVRLAT